MSEIHATSAESGTPWVCVVEAAKLGVQETYDAVEPQQGSCSVEGATAYILDGNNGRLDKEENQWSRMLPRGYLNIAFCFPVISVFHVLLQQYRWGVT